MSSMKSPIVASVAALSLVGALSGCASDGQGGLSKQTVGSAAGAIAGGLIGSQIGGGSGAVAATVIGGVLGALAGSELGRRLDERDELLMRDAAQRALETKPSGEPVVWNNPDTGNRGEFTPEPPYRDEGQICRDFTQTITIEGRGETARGVACRQADGTWKIVNT